MARRGTRPLALAYHGVADVAARQDPHRLFVEPDRLRRHVRALLDWGYELVPFSRFAERVIARDADGLACLTFDDGLADNLHTLVPILAEFDVPATVFVVSGWLGRSHVDAPDHCVLDADELRALAAAGVEIGAHSVTHVDLGAVDYERALEEMQTSKRELETVLGAPVDVFAYPYGRSSPDARRACRDAGFAFAGSVLGRRSGDPFDVHRESMGNASTLAGLRLKRDGRYEPAMDRLIAARALRLFRYHAVRR